MSKLDRLMRIWDEVYNPSLDTLSVIETFFHPGFIQCINGIELDRAHYIEHVLNQKKTMTVNKIEYAKSLENNQQLFVIYYPRGIDVNKKVIEAEVILYVEFLENQIYKMHGQVRLIQGDASSVDMADVKGRK